MATIHDPGAMRALAHPLRMRLLEAVAATGPATATELSAVLGDSPSNCSFHLRTLARFGYIERAPGTGRARPWRVVDVRQDLVADHDDPVSVDAAGAAGEAILEWEMSRLRGAVHRRNPPEWRGATHHGGATLVLTPQEARGLEADITALVAAYLPRTTDPGLRPAGGAVVRLFTALSLVPELTAALGSDGDVS